ncbi:MAG: hypothetical protein ACFFCQ_00810 [Promethearchaeota archaeon]
MKKISSGTITLILFESALELVPRSLAHHSSVIKQKKRENIKGIPILDVTFHHTAMNSLNDKEKRGRPDIVHNCLLWLSSSPIWTKGKLRVFVHTINNFTFEVLNGWRVPPNQIRFNGLMRRLLSEGELKFGTQRIILRKETVEQIKESVTPTFTFLFSKNGEKIKISDISRLILGKNKPLLLVGGYQKGEINPKIVTLADRIISLSDEILSSFAVVSRLITTLELLEEGNAFK